MKKNTFVLALALPLLLAACATTPSVSSSDQPSNTSSDTVKPVVKKYTVTFANTTLPSVEIEEGKTLARPADPTKTGYIFGGWYMDASFTEEAKFPLTITKDTTIYANFFSHKDAFEKARKNTIGDQVPGYTYNYNVTAAAEYMAVKFQGNTVGKAKFNPSSPDVTFYDEHKNSGSLFYDGTKYQMKKGRELHTVSLDQNNQIDSYKIKEVGDAYKYDSSSFAKAVFEYDDKQLKEIKPTSVPNEYKLKTSFGWSNAIALVGNYINHPIIEKMIGTLPETSAQTGMYVTFNNGKLNTYRYEIAINVQGLIFSLKYSMSFQDVGVAPSITAPVFNNTYVGAADVNRVKTELNGHLDAYKNLAHSSYDYLAKTAVDYKGKNAIDATVKGFAKRKVDAGQVYFLNDYEIDSDLKNADLYKDTGLKDLHAARVKLSTGEVHDVKKKLTTFGGVYDDVKVVAADKADDFYLFDTLAAIGEPTFIQKIEDTANQKLTYAVGASTAGAINVLKAMNDGFRLNALGECTANPKALGTFVDQSVEIKTFKFSISLVQGALSEMKLEVKGGMKTAYEGSRDFKVAEDAGFKLDYTLTTNDKGATYEPAATVSKVK